MNEAVRRRLPSVDWIAFGVGVLGMALSYIRPPLMGLVALAVFLPSALREIGWLRDADEFTLGVMRRAGFHMALAVAGLVFLNHGLWMTGVFTTGDKGFDLNGELLRKVVVMTFLVSYLLQYQGARRGAAWVLTGMAITSLVLLTVYLGPQRDKYDPTFLWGIILPAVIMLAMAGLALRHPRAAGGILLLAFAGLVCLGLRQDMPRSEQLWGWLGVLIQTGLIFGVTGIALLRAHPNDDL